MKRIGTIIHGALGDCYEQLLSIRLIRERASEPQCWVGFFVVGNRLDAMKHFQMDMLDEIFTIGQIAHVKVDEFFLFQAKDYELLHDVYPTLPADILRRFDLKRINKPWCFLRTHDFAKRGLRLELSELGKEYLPVCMRYNHIDPAIFDENFTVGFLWRYRSGVGMAKSYFNRPKKWVIETKTELFTRLINDYKAHIIVAGMAKDNVLSDIPDDVRTRGAFVLGEHQSKVAKEALQLPKGSATFLRGLGYAAEMEIMSRCHLLLLMPSGFSEPLWMMQRSPVLLIDPVPLYMLKLYVNRMPLFNNNDFNYAVYNNFTAHTAENVIRFLKTKKYLFTNNTN